jgi:hypothetical protein
MQIICGSGALAAMNKTQCPVRSDRGQASYSDTDTLWETIPSGRHLQGRHFQPEAFCNRPHVGRVRFAPIPSRRGPPPADRRSRVPPNDPFRQVLAQTLP